MITACSGLHFPGPDVVSLTASLYKRTGPSHGHGVHLMCTRMPDKLGVQHPGHRMRAHLGDEPSCQRAQAPWQWTGAGARQQEQQQQEGQQTQPKQPVKPQAKQQQQRQQAWPWGRRGLALLLRMLRGAGRKLQRDARARREGPATPGGLRAALWLYMLIFILASRLRSPLGACHHHGSACQEGHPPARVWNCEPLAACDCTLACHLDVLSDQVLAGASDGCGTRSCSQMKP